MVDLEKHVVKRPKTRQDCSPEKKLIRIRPSKEKNLSGNYIREKKRIRIQTSRKKTGSGSDPRKNPDPDLTLEKTGSEFYLIFT